MVSSERWVTFCRNGNCGCVNGRGDPRLLDPDERVARAHDRLRSELVGEPEPRAEVVPVELARRARLPSRPAYSSFCVAEVEDRALVVGLGRREVQRVAQAGVDGQARARPASRPGRKSRGPWPARGTPGAGGRWRSSGPGRGGSWRARGRCPSCPGRSVPWLVKRNEPGRRRRLDDVEPLAAGSRDPPSASGGRAGARTRPRSGSRRSPSRSSCWRTSRAAGSRRCVKVGSAFSKAAFVGIPGRPRAADGVPSRSRPVRPTERRV